MVVHFTEGERANLQLFRSLLSKQKNMIEKKKPWMILLYDATRWRHLLGSVTRLVAHLRDSLELKLHQACNLAQIPE